VSLKPRQQEASPKKLLSNFTLTQIKCIEFETAGELSHSSSIYPLLAELSL